MEAQDSLVYDHELNAALAAFDAHEHRVYANEKLDLYAIVDEIDYQWAVQWRWNAKRSNRSAGVYLRRAVGVNAGGIRLQTYSLYLHVEIMRRAEIIRPSPRHLLVDHRNGDTLDCRRCNLRWSTYSMNSRNIRGSHGESLFEK